MNRDAKSEHGAPEVTLETLAAMGLGPDAPLLRDPKIFLDSRFLGALIAELEAELGPVGAGRALFQIGAAHGIRDARKALDATPGVTSTALAMQLCPTLDPDSGVGFEGEWPHQHEAEARLAKLGRCETPRCALSAGYTSGWLSESHDLDIVAVETECAAAGHVACRFRAAERSTWIRDHGSHPDLPELDRPRLGHDAPAPFEETLGPIEEPQAVLDPSDEAVHVWGPVMVLPFTRPDDALATIQLLGRDKATAQVRAVVVDLRQQPLDPGYGAEMLAHVLDAVEAWGAEAVLTGICTLSTPIVDEVVETPVLIRKDLPEAVASAFQIAEAQRHPL